MNEKLAAEIVRMTDEDQLMRRKMQTMHEELISVDARNTLRLREIVAEIGWPLAYLVDRILLAEGRPQRYGTQLRTSDHGLGPAPIEDPTGVDDRRHGVGLEPIAEYVRRAKGPPG